MVLKAQDEVPFSRMYAELCALMARTPLKSMVEDVDFKKLLLERCQAEFETELAVRLQGFESCPQVSGCKREEVG